MKISIRRGMFETNSSSMHSLIITNKKELENDKKEFEETLKYCFYCYNSIDSKEDKCYFLAGAFICLENESYEHFELEMSVLLQLLRDKNETEILKNIEKDKKNYLSESYSPACCNYYEEGTLVDCTCHLYTKFKNYFKVNLYVDYDKLKEAKKELYDKLEEFIYGDGVILAYDEY